MGGRLEGWVGVRLVGADSRLWGGGGEGCARGLRVSLCCFYL